MHFKHKGSYLANQVLTVILTLLFFTEQVGCQLTASIYQSSSIINSASNQQITITFQNIDIPAGSYLVLQYSANWATAGITGYNASSDFCETNCNISSIQCITNATGHAIQLKNFFLRQFSPNENIAIRYTLKNFVNPAFQLTQAISISLLDNTASLIDITTATINVYAQQITCSAARSSTLVSSYAQYQFTVNPGSLVIPSNVYIIMVFPPQWYSSTSLGTFNTSSYACRGATNPSIACNIVNGNLNITNIILATSSSQFSYNVTQIMNPGSSQVNNQLVLNLYTPNGQIATCNPIISASAVQSIPDLFVNLTGNLGDIIIGGEITFSTTHLSDPNDTVQIQLPIQYDCSILTKAYISLNNESVSGNPTLHVNSTSGVNIITLMPFSAGSIALYHIYLYNIQLPKTTSIIPQTKLSIFRTGVLIATQLCCSTSYSLLAKSGGFSITLSTNMIGSVATHYINVLNSSLFSFPDSYAHMIIQFDPKYTLINPTYNCYIKGSLALIYPLFCTRNTTNRILVTNFNSSISIGRYLFTLGIDTIVTPVTLSSLRLSVITLDSNFNGIQNITTTFALAASKINNVKVTPSSTITYATASYAFSVTNTNLLGAGAFIFIQFPPQIQISAAASCYINNTQLSASNCIVSISNLSAHQVTVALSNPSPISSNNLNLTNITISQITNPLSIAQTSSFIIQLISSSGDIIELLQQGITVLMNAPSASLTNFAITPSNNQTMAVADYSIQYQLPVDVMLSYGINSSYVSKGVTLVIAFPSDFSCNSYSGGVKACMIVGQNSLFTYTLSSTSIASVATFVIKSITNPSIINIATSITASLYLSGYLSIRYTYSSLNSFASSTISYALSQSNYYLGEHSDIFVSISGITNLITSASIRHIQLMPPAQYTVDSNLSISCNQPNAIISTTISGAQLESVKIDNVTSVLNLTIVISNIINPTILPIITKWSVAYKDSLSNGLIAQSNVSTDADFNLICNIPCRSCSSNASFCLSCYTIIASISEKYFDSSANMCISSCLPSQFLSAGMICSPCSTSCQTCANLADNCTSCSASSSTYLYIPTNKCVLRCPPQYYENLTIRQCSACSASCLYCTSASNCSFCSPSYLLTIYMNGTTTCTLNCLGGYYNDSNICKPCPLNCTSCSSIVQCSVCIVGFYLYNGICQSSCPYGLYISIASGNLTCETCQPPCNSCNLFSTNCSNCNTLPATIDKFFVTVNSFSTCSNACSLGQYADQFFICQACLPPCHLCSSAVTCLSCLPGYYYYPNTQQCFTTCPNKSILVVATQQCQQCASPCLSCITTTSTCTSCIQGYFYDSVYSTCNSTCNLPYFAINRLCTRCASPCSTCVNLQPYACLSCIATYLLYGTTCYQSICPEGSYKSSSSQCGSCTSGCLTCTNSSSTCLSCYPGLYLYEQSCLPSCPTSPVRYYEYQMQCIICSALCSSCLSSPLQCVACANSSLYLNQITRQCSFTCTNPYFAGVNASNSSIKLCLKCQLPCKTCTSSQVTCGSCFNGYYLYNSQCLQTCTSLTFPNTQTNTCQSCSSNCQSCTSSNSCTLCQYGTYSFAGSCYVTCPTNAPYVYNNKYCRNCILSNCLLCDESQSAQNVSCFLCEPNYYLYNKSCTSECPEDYEIDLVTRSLCIATAESTLLAYLKILEKFKIYLVPGFTLLFISTIFYFVYFFSFKQYTGSLKKDKANNQKIVWVNLAVCVLALPQTISCLAYLSYLVINPQAYFHSQLFNIALYTMIILFYLLNLFNFILVAITLKKDKLFMEWASSKQNKNYQRYIFMMTLSLILNKKISLIMFSGIWRIPVTCCQISALCQQAIGKRLKILCLFGMFFIQIPLIVYAVYTVLIQKSLNSNYKLFFAAIDITSINLLCIVAQIVFIAKTFAIPKPYNKFILEKVSNRSLPALSIQLPEQPQPEQDHQMHHSNSTDGLKKQSKQMKQIQYKSVFDPSDFQDPDFFEPQQMPNALENGKFRKKNLKKKAKGNKWDLNIIDEQSQESQQKIQKKTKKKPTNKRKKLGYLNNFIYWKPPEKEEKKKPQKQFKLHAKEIMQTIREKQSDFDTITRNDIIFQQQPLGSDSSHDSDPNFLIEDSRRALNFQYQAFLNKNYASRKHLN